MGTRHSSPKIEVLEPNPDLDCATPVSLLRPIERNTTPPPIGYDGVQLSERTPIPLDSSVSVEALPPSSRVLPTLPPGWIVVAATPDQVRSMPLDGRMRYVLGLIGDGALLGEVLDASALGTETTADVVEVLRELCVVRGWTRLRDVRSNLSRLRQRTSGSPLAGPECVRPRAAAGPRCPRAS